MSSNAMDVNKEEEPSSSHNNAELNRHTSNDFNKVKDNGYWIDGNGRRIENNRIKPHEKDKHRNLDPRVKYYEEKKKNEKYGSFSGNKTDTQSQKSKESDEETNNPSPISNGQTSTKIEREDCASSLTEKNEKPDDNISYFDVVMLLEEYFDNPDPSQVKLNGSISELLGIVNAYSSDPEWEYYEDGWLVSKRDENLVIPDPIFQKLEMLENDDIDIKKSGLPQSMTRYEFDITQFYMACMKEGDEYFEAIFTKTIDLWPHNFVNQEISKANSVDDGTETVSTVERPIDEPPVTENCAPQPKKEPIEDITSTQEIQNDEASKVKVKEEVESDSQIYPTNDSTVQNLTENIGTTNQWIASFDANYNLYKNKKAFDTMLRENNLYALFKCMDAKCSYTTICKDNFQTHLDAHQKKKTSKKVNKTFYLYCPYCSFKAKNTLGLIHHYKTDHRNCNFQCNLCFYRSSAAQSVHNHQLEFHTADAKSAILKCPKVYTPNESYEMKIATEKLKKVEGFNCAVCFKEFHVIGDLLEHLEDVHKAIRHAKDQIMRLDGKIKDNKIGNFVCIECPKESPFGTMTSDEIQKHLHKHPTSLHFVGERASQGAILKKLPGRDDLKIKSFGGDERILKNDHRVLRTSIIE